MKAGKYYFKLLLVIFIVALLYASVTSGVYYYNQNESADKRIDAQQRVMIEQVRDKIDGMLLSSLNSINRLKSNDKIMDYSRGKGINPYFNTLALAELRTNNDAYANIGFRIDMTMENSGTVITPDYTIDTSRYFQEQGLDQAKVSQKLFGPASENRPTSIYELESSSSRSVKLAVKAKLPSSAGVVYFFVTFKEDAFIPALGQLTNEAISILYKDQLLFFYSGDQDLLENSTPLHKLLYALNEGRNFTQVERQSKSDHTFYLLSSKVLKDWNYSYIINESAAATGSNGVLRNSLLIGLLCLTAGLIIAAVLARNAYKPVRTLVHYLEAAGNRVKDNRREDEFSFLRSVTDTFQSTNKELTEIIRNQKGSLQSKYLRDLLIGKVSSEHIQEELSKHDLEAIDLPCSVAVFEMTDIKSLDTMERDSVLSVKSQFIAKAEEDLRNGRNGFVIDLDFHRLAIVVCGKTNDEMTKFCNQYIQEMAFNHPLMWKAVVGRTVLVYSDIERSYRDCLYLLELGFEFTRKSVISEEDRSSLFANHLYYPLEAERELIQSIMTGDVKEAESLINQLISRNCDNEDALSGDINSLTFAFITTINRMCLQLQIQSSDIFGQEWQVHLLQTKEHVEGYRQAIMELIRLLLNKVDVKNAELDNVLTDKMVAFIRDQYDKDISLTDISEYLQLSSSYVSVIFKQYTGENFKDYLNIYRVKKAKEFLEREDVKIQDLALLVGCNNANTFIRIFKKYEGISPGQYMKKRDANAG